MLQSNLLTDIRAFMATHSMSRTRFGELALGDRHFVKQLEEKGRRCWPETEDKVRKFMVTYRPEQEAA